MNEPSRTTCSVSIAITATFAFLGGLLLGLGSPSAEAKEPFSADDVFELEWVKDPQISPDGSQVIWVRSGFDRQLDKSMGTIWTTDVATGVSEPLLSGEGSYGNARFACADLPVAGRPGSPLWRVRPSK